MLFKHNTRVSDESIVITLPSQIAKAYDIMYSDFLKYTPLEQGTILMKKRKNEGTMP